MRDFYLKNGHGFILVYSITSHSSFTDIPDMWEQLLRVKDRPHVGFLIYKYFLLFSDFVLGPHRTCWK